MCFCFSLTLIFVLSFASPASGVTSSPCDPEQDKDGWMEQWKKGQSSVKYSTLLLALFWFVSGSLAAKFSHRVFSVLQSSYRKHS